MHIISNTQSGDVKRYESSLGPSFDTNTIGAIITRTNSGDTSYEYKVTADGYDSSTSGTKVVVKYGPSSAVAKKEFWFEVSLKSFRFYTYIKIIDISGNAISEYINVSLPYESTYSDYFDYYDMEINDVTGYNDVEIATAKQGTGTGTEDVFESIANIQFHPNAGYWDSRDGYNQYCRYRIYCAVINSNTKYNFSLAPWDSPNSINNLPTFAKITNYNITSPGSFSGTPYYASGNTIDGLKYLEVKMLGKNMSTDSFNSWEGIEVYCQDNNTSNPGTKTTGKYSVDLLIYNRMGINAPRMRVNISIIF